MAEMRQKYELFEVICPDGLRRHYPYRNEDDARFDAEVFSRRCECPGPHEVRPNEPRLMN